MTRLFVVLFAFVFVAVIGLAPKLAGGQTIPPRPRAYLPQINRAENTPTATNTVEPTPTATLMATPTETPTVTPTATTVNSGVVVLDNHSTRVTNIESFHITGEVQNNSTSNVRFVRITADIYNSAGQLIDIDDGYTWVSVLTAGQKGCFDVLFLDEPDGWASYRLSVEYDETTEQPRPASIVSVNPGSNFLGYELVGEVRNDGTDSLEYVQIVSTLYNNDNKVIDCDFTFSNADTLAPGATSSWKNIFVGIEPDDVANYVVVAD